MKVCAFDPGVINLSHCLTNENKIVLWGNHSILQDRIESFCQGTLKNGNNCTKKSTFSNGQTNCCSVHSKKFEQMKKIKIKKVKNYVLQELVLFFVEYINNFIQVNATELLGTDLILIELQPKCNPKTKLLSNILFGKFTEHFAGTKCKVRFVTARAKLKGVKTTHDLKTYKGRKMASVDECRRLLPQCGNEDWVQFFEDQRIRADLADTALYCWSVFK